MAKGPYRGDDRRNHDPPSRKEVTQVLMKIRARMAREEGQTMAEYAVVLGRDHGCDRGRVHRPFRRDPGCDEQRHRDPLEANAIRTSKRRLVHPGAALTCPNSCLAQGIGHSPPRVPMAIPGVHRAPSQQSEGGDDKC